VPHLEPGPDEQPLDAWDPRFAGDSGPGGQQRDRRLVRSRGPGPSHEDPQVRRIRLALPLVFFTALGVIAVIFFQGLQPGEQHEVLGREASVRAAVADRPRRVCLNDNNPCAWVTLVGDRLVAFNTNGPLPQEYGRDGIGWCPSSAWFGANATGSRFDQQGRVAGGPAPRGLDRFEVSVRAGEIVVDFTQLTSGLQRDQVRQITPPAGQDCSQIPFDRAADLTIAP
jgi:hypothetical protein